MSDWREAELGEMITLQRGYDLPERSRKPGQIPVVSSSGISGYHSEARVLGPGVVTGRYGTLGQVYYIEEDFWPHNTTLFVKDFHGNDRRFAYYLLGGLNLVHQSAVSAVPGVNRNDLHRLPVKIPPLPTQRRVAQILSRLDDKIELNRRINRTLEAMAQALYKHWFVDFGPFQAGEFVESKLGLIPKGWKVAQLGQHIVPTKGLSYKGSGLSEEGVPLHNLNSVLEGGGYKYAGIKYYTGEYKEKHLIKPGDVIVANTEQGFDYLLIGCPAIVPKRYGDFGLFTHHIFKVQILETSPLSSYFIYFLLKDPNFRSIVTANTNGTTVNMLSKDGLTSPEIILPPREVIQSFDKIVKSILGKIELNEDENVKLATTRDYLLPKLLRGEISV